MNFHRFIDQAGPAVLAFMAGAAVALSAFGLWLAVLVEL